MIPILQNPVCSATGMLQGISKSRSGNCQQLHLAILLPRYLGIGTLTLEDGSQAKGFVCEPYAIEHATDITHYGGWRAYLADQ
jgi:hypothetical protein